MGCSDVTDRGAVTAADVAAVQALARTGMTKAEAAQRAGVSYDRLRYIAYRYRIRFYGRRTIQAVQHDASASIGAPGGPVTVAEIDAVRAHAPRLTRCQIAAALGLSVYRVRRICDRYDIRTRGPQGNRGAPNRSDLYGRPERVLLAALARGGWPYAVIAAVLGRSIKAVKCRLHAWGLSLWDHPKAPWRERKRLAAQRHAQTLHARRRTDPALQRLFWEGRFPWLAVLSPQELETYRHLTKVKDFCRAEALTVLAADRRRAGGDPDPILAFIEEDDKETPNVAA